LDCGFHWHCEQGSQRAGRLLEREAKDILARWRGLRTALYPVAGQRIPVLRIGVIGLLSAMVVPDLVRCFKSRSDEIKVVSGLALDLHGLLVQGSVDVILTTDGLYNLDGFRRTKLVREPLVLVLPRRGNAIASVDDVRHLPWPLIRLNPNSGMGRDIEHPLRRLRLEVVRFYEFDGLHTIVRMIVEGLGWTIATPISIFDARRGAASVRIEPFPGPAFSRDVFVVSRTGEHESIIGDLADCVRSTFRRTLLPRLRTATPWLDAESLLNVEPHLSSSPPEKASA
jgi:DNA-binding transcriptional LysR family regulator